MKRPMKRPGLFMLILLLRTATPALAGGAAGSLDLDDAAPLASGEVRPSVAADRGFVIVWKDGPTVMARELGSEGLPKTVPLVIDDVSRSRVAGLDVDIAGPDFVVAWTDPFATYDYFGRSYEVFAQRWRDGAPIGDRLDMHPRSQDSTSVTGLAGRVDGRFLVAWNNSFPYGPSSRRTQAFSPTDQFLQNESGDSALEVKATDDEFAVLGRASYGPRELQRHAVDGTEQESVAVGSANDFARAPGEGFLVVWRDFQNRHFAQTLDTAFAADGAAMQISDSTALDRSSIVTAGVDGGFLMAWNLDDGTRSSRLRYLRPDGVLEPGFELAGLTASFGFEPEIAVDRYGRFVATWVDDDTVWTRHGRIDRGIEVDSFETAQAQLQISATLEGGGSASSTASGLDMVGGERDLQLSLSGGTSGAASVEVVGGQLVHQQTGDVTASSTVVWDQADGDATALDAFGLRALDLASGGTRDAVEISIVTAGAGASLVLEVGDGVGTSAFTLDLPVGATGETFVIPLADFTGSADLGKAGSLSLTIDGTGTSGLDVTLERVRTISRLAGSKTALDLDGGALEPGDVLEYSIEIDNAVDSHGAGATGVTFADVAPPGTALICVGVNAPTVSQGTISGCVAGEDGQIDADLGAIADGASATVTFRVTLQGDAPGRLCNEGLIASSTLVDVLTDDPATASALDATCVDATAPATVTISKSFVLIVDDDNNGLPTAGDVARITAVVEHAAGVRDAEDLVFTSEAEHGSFSSVSTTAGIVTSGNGGESTVVVELGTLEPGGQETITYDLFIGTLPMSIEDFRVATLVEGTGVWARELMIFDGLNFGPGADLHASLRDVLIDLNGDDFASAGDRLRYESVVRNSGGRDVEMGKFTSGIFDHTELVAGSVQTNAGVVVTGNNPGDTTVDIDIGEVGGLGSSLVIISFEVLIDEPLPDGVDEVSRRAFVSGLGVSAVASDDVDTPGPDNPTVTPISEEPAAMVTLVDEMVSDPLGDGLLQIGDRLGFTLEIINTGIGSLHLPVATVINDAAMQWLCETISLPPGASFTCNPALGGELNLQFGKIPEGGSITASWTAEAVDIQTSAPVCSQGHVSAIGVFLPSDDPDLPGDEDPTCRGATAPGDLIFFDGFESGNASAWSAAMGL